MPTLKQLQCTVEWSGTEAPLTEYNTRYEDGKVETHIAVPETATPFAIRLKSMGYIASGLAMFVYIDGEYQCNRNRQNLRTPKGNSSHRRTEVNFVVRQKEAALDDESFLAKPWRFEKLNTAFGDSQTFSHNVPYQREYGGVIEVVVLRCFPKIESLAPTIPQTLRTPVQQQKTTPARFDAAIGTQKTVPTDDQAAPLKGGKFDGACDSSCHSIKLIFGVDGSWEDPNSNQGASVTGQKKWGIQMTGSNTGVYQPIGPTAGQERHDRNGPPDHAKRGWLQSPKGTPPQGPPHLTSREISQTSPQHILPASPTIVINVTHGASQPPPQWIFPGDTGGSVAGSCATPSSPYEHTEPVHEMAQNLSAKDAPGGSSNHGVNVISTDNSGSTVTSKSRNDWSFDQPRAQGIPGAWIDADDVGWANTGNNNEVPDWDSKTQNENRSWEDINKVGSNNSECWNGNNISGWPNDTIGKKDKSNNTDGWYNSHSLDLGKNDSWDNSKDSNMENNDGWNHNKSPNQGNDDSWANDKGPSQGNDHKWKANNSPNHAHSWVSEPAPQKNHTNDRNASKSPKGRDGNVTSIHKSWKKQGGRHRGSPMAHEVGTLGQQPVANGHEVGDRNTPTQVSQASFNNQIPLGSLRSGQPHNSIPGPAPPSERGDQYNSLNELQGGQKNSGFSAKVDKTSFPDQPISKPSELGPKPYWASWNSSHLPESSRIGNPEYRSPRAEPTPTVAQETSNRRHLSHQVRSGKPLLYLHKVASPSYMDSHKSPYAVFVFNYRSKELLEQKFNVTVTEPVVDEKERLKHVSKEEIIEQYLRIKEALSVASRTNSPAQNGLCGTPMSQQPNTGQQSGSSNLQQNLNGIGIDMGPIEEKLNNMEINDKTRGRSESANPAFIWENNASAQTEDPLSQQGNTGDKNRTTMMNEDGHKTNRRSDPTNENVASDSNNINWGGEDHNGDSSAKGSPAKTVWGGPDSDWKNESHSPSGGVSDDREKDWGWVNEGQANGGWDNSRAEENADVAW